MENCRAKELITCIYAAPRLRAAAYSATNIIPEFTQEIQALGKCFAKLFITKILNTIKTSITTIATSFGLARRHFITRAYVTRDPTDKVNFSPLS